MIKNGDLIEVDINKKKINVKASAEELRNRKKKIGPFKPKVMRGWLARYASFVESADKGAVLSLSSKQ